MTQENHYDVVIVGAGIVGLTLACALSQANLTCAVIEARPRPQPFSNKLPYGLRVSALTRASEQIFRHLDIWPLISEMRYTPYYHMQVWDQHSQGEVSFSANMISQPNLGYIVENEVILSALLAKLTEHDRVALRFDTQAESATITPSPSVTLKQGETLTADLVVAADGARSWLRQQVGLSIRRQPYDQSAIVATIRTEKKHDFVARQIFLQHGPLAFLPLDDEHHCTIVWSQATEQATTLTDIAPEAFNKVLTKSFQDTLGQCEVIGPRAAFPLVRSHASHYFKPGCVLIGDAAHSIHPLAGQGLNLGLLDAACLAEVLQYAHEHQRPLASQATLRRYERKRHWHNGVVMRLMDGFHLGFGQHASTLNKIREIGMATVNRFDCLKQPIMKQALGLCGPLPQLARA